MDFVNKTYAQLVDVFKGLTPGTRIAAGLLLGAIVVALVYLFQYQATGSDEYLLGGRPFVGDELTRAEAAFAKAGLGKSVVAEGGRIRIPHGQKDQYLAALGDSNALPADFYRYLDEAAAGENPFSSSKTLDFRRSTAKQKELALIISRMRGIASASVQYDEAVKPGPRGEKQRTAMVVVTPEDGELEDGQVRAIRNIIASAYAGLDRQNISITDTESSHSFGGGGREAGMNEEDSIYATYKQQFERDWKQKIHDQLRWIPGSIVNVNVELSPELQNTTQEVKLDTKPVTLASNEFSKESTTTQKNIGGRPGAEANGAGGNRPVELTSSSSAPESQTNESRSELQQIPGHSVVTRTSVPLMPTKVTAAIQIPMSYLTRIWQQKNPTPAGQQPTEPDPAQVVQLKEDTKKKIQETVRNLLPQVTKGEDPYPHITVEAYDDLPTKPVVPPSVTAQAGAWFADNWRGLAMVVVGLFSLVMLRGMVRSQGSAPAPAAAPAAELAIAEEPQENEVEEEEEAATVLRRKFATGGPNLKQELHLLVKENPDAAASILKNWIGDAA